MSNVQLCKVEKSFILHGVQENFRIDGRSREDYRPMEIETNIILHAFGSARIRLAGTDVLVGVKLEVDSPFPDKPKEGKLEFFVDCSANATPQFEGRGGEDLAIEIAGVLRTAYQSPAAFDYEQLCILPGQKCWKVFVDILILSCDGNLFDAVSLATKTALWNTQIPTIRDITFEGNNIEMFASDKLTDCEKLNIQDVPVIVTLCRIEDQFIVDPNKTEELCCAGSVAMAFSNGKITAVIQTDTGSLTPENLVKYLKIGQSIAERLDKKLWEVLGKIKPHRDIGFIV